MNTDHSNLFPSKVQEVLLKAALFQGDEAVYYWNEWNNLVNFEAFFDNGSFWLMPLVYKNLVDIKPEIKYLGKLKNIYLQSWYKNQKLFSESASIPEPVIIPSEDKNS